MEKIKPYLPTLFLLVLCAIMPKMGYGADQPWYGGFFYHFAHANLWHFGCNFFVLFRFKPRWENLPIAYLSATAGAYLPFTEVSAPTIGLSAMIFAMLARRDVILHILNWQLLLFNALFIFLPQFNWKIHLISYLIAYILWTIIQKIR